MARQAFARQRELIQQLTRRRSASAPLIGHGECRTHRTRLKKTETLGRHAVNGGDLWRDPLEVRKATLASVLAKAGAGIRFNEHIEGDGPTVFAHACKLGLEGIVSKRKDPLPLRPLARLAQVEESERSGGEAGGRGGLGALTAPARAFSAASHKNFDIALASFRKLDDRSGDDFIAEVAWAFDSRSGHFERDAQETGGLRIEGLAA